MTVCELLLQNLVGCPCRCYCFPYSQRECTKLQHRKLLRIDILCAALLIAWAIIWVIESKGMLFIYISELHCRCTMVLCALLHPLTHEYIVFGESTENDSPWATATESSRLPLQMLLFSLFVARMYQAVEQDAQAAEQDALAYWRSQYPQNLLPCALCSFIFFQFYTIEVL